MAHLLTVALICFWSASLFGSTDEIADKLHSLELRQSSQKILECVYFLSGTAQAREITAIINDKMTLPQIKISEYPDAFASPTTTALLFLVDTSHPKRQPVIDKTITHIHRILDQARPHQQFGLAKFDTERVVLGQIGELSPEELKRVASNLKAEGKTTQLYMHTETSLRELANFAATRKALILFSDGAAEDNFQTDFHKNVVARARTHKIMIYALGYPFQEVPGHRMDILRSLSQETGGLFTQADETTLELPESFFQAPFAQLENGGIALFNLGPLARAVENNQLAQSSSYQVRLTFKLDDETSVTMDHAVNLPLALPVQPARTLTPQEPRSNPVAEDTPPRKTSDFSGWAWGLTLAALIAALFIGLILWNKRGTKPPVVHAIIEYQDENGESQLHEMTTTTLQIGRHTDNELQLVDTSVSSHHAVIYLQRNGSFILNDLNSTNGVILNGCLLTNSSALLHQDEIELGEVKLTFHINNIE